MEIYKKWLRSEGIKFEENSYGIEFKHLGAKFLLWDNSKDPLYLALSLPSIWKVDNNEYEVLKVINKINTSNKSVKAVVRDSYVWLNIEMFIEITPHIEIFMNRLATILIGCMLQFLNEMNNQQN